MKLITFFSWMITLFSKASLWQKTISSEVLSSCISFFSRSEASSNNSCLLGKLAARTGLQVGLQQLMKCLNLMVGLLVSTHNYMLALKDTLSINMECSPQQAEGEPNA